MLKSMATALAGLLISGAAWAAPVTGNSHGSSFSSLAGCGILPCAINANGGQGPNSRVQWGTFLPILSPNTLTARDVSFHANTPANDVTLAALRWSNPVNLLSPQSFNVQYNLPLSFGAPFGAATLALPLTIQGPVGADHILGLTPAALAGMAFNLPNLLVSDVKFVLDAGNSTAGTSFNATTGRWTLPEGGASTLLLTADFTAVPGPAALGLFAMALLGLAVAGRRAPETM